jgi:hypothetical protein
MRDRGWAANREDLLQGTLLDWVYGTTKGNTVPRLGTFMDDTPDVDQDTLHGLVAALESRGLIQLNRGMGITASGAHLTAHGRTIVRQRQERRSNVKERVAAAREALLDWFYEQKRVGTHFRSRSVCWTTRAATSRVPLSRRTKSNTPPSTLATAASSRAPAMAACSVPRSPPTVRMWSRTTTGR